MKRLAVLVTPVACVLAAGVFVTASPANATPNLGFVPSPSVIECSDHEDGIYSTEIPSEIIIPKDGPEMPARMEKKKARTGIVVNPSDWLPQSVTGSVATYRWESILMPSNKNSAAKTRNGVTSIGQKIRIPASSNASVMITIVAVSKDGGRHTSTGFAELNAGKTTSMTFRSAPVGAFA